MTPLQGLIVLAVSAFVGIVAAVRVLFRRNKAPRSNPRSDALRQNLRTKVLYDEAKIDRLIDFEREELKRKGQRPEAVEELMEKAIRRWERDNAGAAPLY